jgi:hypothetical protein
LKNFKASGVATIPSTTPFDKEENNGVVGSLGLARTGCAAEEGRACVFISSELEEVLRTSHRIVVLREREKVAEFAGEVDENTIIRAFAGSEA